MICALRLDHLRRFSGWVFDLIFFLFWGMGVEAYSVQCPEGSEKELWI